MPWVLDTSVYSQVLRRNGIAAVLERWEAVGDDACRITTTVRAEVEWGLHWENNPERLRVYHHRVRDRLDCLPTDADVWTRFSGMKARQREIGEPVGDLDLLIAATAAHHGLTLATLNTRDFSRIEGLTWEDWGR